VHQKPKPKQSKAKQSKAKQSKAKQSKAKQSKAKQKTTLAPRSACIASKLCSYRIWGHLQYHGCIQSASWRSL
jgi:hypothetical protein